MTASGAAQPVGLWRRLAAGAYDLLLVLALWMVISALFLPFNDGDAPAPGTLLFQVHRLSLLLATAAFFIGFWRYGGQTLGMRAWRIQLVRADGSQPDATDCTKRLLAALVSLFILGLGFAAAMLDPQQRTWHDRWTGTRLRRAG